MSDILLFPLKALLIGIDVSITLLTFGWIGCLRKALRLQPNDTDSNPLLLLRSVPVHPDDNPSHRVHRHFKDNLASVPREGAETLYDLAREAFSLYPAHRCLGVRQFMGWTTRETKNNNNSNNNNNNNHLIKHFGPAIQWTTYQQVSHLAHGFGAALRARGLLPAPSTTTLEQRTAPCSLAIFENTCPEWLIASLGAFSQSIIVTTIYATLGMDAVVDAINDGHITAILCNKFNVANILGRIHNMKTLKTIIYTNDAVPPDDDTLLPEAPKGVQIIQFFDFANSGNVTAFPPTPPKPQTCAVIMYTSGSTGKPKGVVITHSSIVASCTSAQFVLDLKKGKDVYLAYLPMAHILELMSEFSMISLGCTICYADPKTLTTTGAYPIGALEQYSPTLMAAVPKIWDVLQKAVKAKIDAAPPPARWLIRTAFQFRSFANRNGFDTPLFRALVFRKFARVVGGKLRMALSGGGPLNSEVQQFIRTCFGFPLVQGYGLTETSACLSIQDADDLRPGVVGCPAPSCEVKLVSTPDICDKTGLPYLNTDRIDVDGNPIWGRGEILTRGHNISSGYYMMPEKTREVYQDDGFFQTGDIGQFMADGSIRIVDRKKNLVKLKGGEYIALEAMEMTYGNSNFVDAIAGGICCYGDGDMDRPVALMQLSEAVTMKWANDSSVAGDFDTVRNRPELYDAVMASMMGEHKKSGLSALEKLKAVAFISTPWTPENGCLTAANKLQRRAVVAMFEKEFLEVKKKGIF